jgi:hypothetical protein
MKALISTTENFNYSWVSDWFKNNLNEWEPIYSTIENCQRVAQVEPDNKIFEVHQTLFWVDCPDNCAADQWYYKDGSVYIKQQSIPKPEDVPTPEGE